MQPYSTRLMIDAILGGGFAIPPTTPTQEDLEKLRARSIDLAIAHAKPAKVVEVVTPQPESIMPVEGKLLNAPVADASEGVII